MNGSNLEKEADNFNEKPARVKSEANVSFGWYPYRSMGNFITSPVAYLLAPDDERASALLRSKSFKPA